MNWVIFWNENASLASLAGTQHTFLLSSFPQCLTCSCCGTGCAGFIDSVLATIAAVWWCIAGAVLTRWVDFFMEGYGTSLHG